MRKKPTDEYEEKELAKLNAEPWMVQLLDFNPDYTSWGPHEDYMCGEPDGWSGSLRGKSWEEIGSWTLDDLNELVNFYFQVSRKSKECEVCGGTGYHKDALWVSESFYEHSSPFKVGFPSQRTMEKYSPEFAKFCREMEVLWEWCQNITDDEVAMLAEGNRLFNFGHKRGDPLPSAVQVNSHRGAFIGHDAINRCMLIEHRCKRFGIPLHCETCNGHGHVYTAPAAHVNLVLWFLHPRKGASRGVEVVDIKQSDLPSVFAFLRKAAERNAARFSRIPIAFCDTSSGVAESLKVNDSHCDTAT